MMESVANKRLKFVLKLAGMTREGKIDWQGTVSSVSANIGGRIVELSESETNEMNPIEVVRIHKGGFGEELLDSFTDEDLGEATNKTDEAVWVTMKNMRVKAERQASKVDQTLDGLMEALDQLDIDHLF